MATSFNFAKAYTSDLDEVYKGFEILLKCLNEMHEEQIRVKILNKKHVLPQLKQKEEMFQHYALKIDKLIKDL